MEKKVHRKQKDKCFVSATTKVFRLSRIEPGRTLENKPMENNMVIRLPMDYSAPAQAVPNYTERNKGLRSRVRL